MSDGKDTAMDDEAVRKMLRRACEAAGGQKIWGEANSVSQQYISDVLRGRTEPGGKLLDALGLERVMIYRRKAAQPGSSAAAADPRPRPRSLRTRR